MQDYEKEFCKGVINDTDANQEIIEIFDEIFEGNKFRFIRDNLNHSNIYYIDLLVQVIDGDVEDFLEVFDVDYDSLNSLENSRDKWENSDFSGEIEDRIEELQEKEEEYDDEDW